MNVTLDDSCWEGVDDSTEALVEQWLVQLGSKVTAGQPLADVVVVKASYQVTAPADGVLTEILVPAEGTFPRGAPIAVLQTS